MITISSTHKPRVVGDYVIVEIRLIAQKRTSSGDIKSDPAPGTSERPKQNPEEKPKLPRVKFYYPGLDEWSPNVFEKAYLEKPGQISLKKISADREYPNNHILVHVISDNWGSPNKLSIKVEDIREPMHRIMFHWKRDPCPDLLNMRPNWIYRISNFEGHRYGSSVVSGGIQIKINANTRIEPMPENLDIRLPFNPQPIDVRLFVPDRPDKPLFVDTVARIIRVTSNADNRGFDLIASNELKTQFGHGFRIDCSHSSKREEAMAEKYIGRTIMIRNAFDPKPDPKYNVVVTKDFVAMRLENERMRMTRLAKFQSNEPDEDSETEEDDEKPWPIGSESPKASWLYP